MDELLTKLRNYPSSFDVSYNINDLKRRNIITKILSEDEHDFTFLHSTEKERNGNIISFLFYIGKDYKKALKHNARVLNMNPANIIAKANKAWFLLRQVKSITEIKRILDELETLNKSTLACLVAKAELAFTHSKLNQHLKAYQLYKEIHEECLSVIRSDESKSEIRCQIPKEYISIWTSGFCLIQRRLLHVNNMPVENLIQPTLVQYKQLIETYMEIINVDTDLNFINRIKARSLVDFGFLVYDINMNRKDYPQGIKDICPEQSFNDEIWYFERALELKPDDVCVLEKCGKYFRYRKDIELSVMYLKSAISKRPTSFGYHHLGLSLKRKLEMSLTQSDDNFNKTWGGKSSGSKDDRHGKFATKLIKNPRKLINIDLEKHKTDVTYIMYCFDKAMELSSNIPALYDKGLLFRQTNQHEAALEVFKSIIKDEDMSSSPVYKANAYEQSAMCLIAMLRKGQNDNDTDVVNEIKFYLKSSLEVSYKTSEKYHRLKNCWLSGSILRDLLELEPNTKEKFQELLFLDEKEENYEEALHVLDELTDCASDVHEKVRALEHKASICLKSNKHDDAVLTLESLKKNARACENMDEHLYKYVNVKAGLNAFKTNEFLKAHLRLRNAFDFVKEKPSNEATNQSEETTNFDIFILSNMTDDIHGQHMMLLLNKAGLRTISNADNVYIRPGSDELHSLKRAIERSRYAIIINDFNKDDMEMGTHLISCILKTMKTSNILVVNEPNEEFPTILKGNYKCIDMRLDSIGDDLDVLKDPTISEVFTCLFLELLGCAKQ